jgi:hypothetical protein
MNKWLQIVFGAAQAISALVLMLLALWAVFFTSLPEVLISQLRSEITEAKSEIVELRDQKSSIQQEFATASRELTDLKLERDVLAGSIGDLRNDLKLKEEDAASLSKTNRELQTQGIALEQIVSALGLEKSELEAAVDVLRDERAVYAGQTLDVNLSKVAAFACYRLSDHYFDARVATNYGTHRAWLNANRRLAILQEAYDALSLQEQYSEENQTAVEYRKLQNLARSVPEIWFGLPSEPNLDPDAGSRLLGDHALRLLNLNWGKDHERLHSYLINLFFDRTVRSTNVRELTVEAFVEELSSLPFLGDLLVEEKEVLVEVLIGFIPAHPSLRGMSVNVVYQSEPSAGQIPEGARVVMSNLEQVRDELAAFFTERGVTSFGECSFPN